MPKTRCCTNSTSACWTLPDCHRSVRLAASRRVSPRRSSRALSSTAPPSELAWAWSNRATMGCDSPWHSKVTCAIQSVAIEPPGVWATKRLNTASIAPLRGSVAVLFHRSRIKRASTAAKPEQGAAAPDGSSDAAGKNGPRGKRRLPGGDHHVPLRPLPLDPEQDLRGILAAGQAALDVLEALHRHPVH